MSISRFATRAALTASLILAGGALTSAQAQRFGHGFAGGIHGAAIGHGFGAAGLGRGFAGPGFARPAFGVGFARSGFAPSFTRTGLITGRSVGFVPRTAFAPRFA